ncbi:MAG: hypothetical protein JRI35_01515 [Deltaproteobacteria bacterium]|nr:hypothetical protein [Deltaproteobacteria bacterium]
MDPLYPALERLPFSGFQSSLIADRRGSAIWPATQNPVKRQTASAATGHRGAPSGNDLRQPCSFLGLRNMGNPRLRSAAEENGGGSPMLRRP